MDTLTHIVIGGIAGAVIAGKRFGKRSMLVGAIAANLPDLDGFMNFVVSDAESMLVHRGISHSLILALVAGPLIGWCCSRFFDKGLADPGTWIMLITSNLILHDLLDTCTMYGTGLLMPFSDHRFSWDNIFVADPVFTLPLLISALLVLFTNKKYFPRVKLAWSGVLVSSCYLIYTFFAHHSAISHAQQAANNNELKYSEIIAVPTLFNSILWYVVVKNENDFSAGYYSVFDREPIALYTILKKPELETLAGDKSAVKFLKDFSKDFYCYRIKNEKVYFNDLRFGQINGWDSPDSDFAFSFDLTPGADNKMVVQQGRVEGTRKEVLNSMIKRMKGN